MMLKTTEQREEQTIKQESKHWDENTKWEHDETTKMQKGKKKIYATTYEKHEK